MQQQSCSESLLYMRIARVGQNHIYTVYMTVFLAGKSSNIRSYTVCIYGFGQPYTSHTCVFLLQSTYKRVMQQQSCLRSLLFLAAR